MNSVRLISLWILASACGFSSLSRGAEPLCSQTNYTVPIRQNVSAHVGYFETFSPQGAVIFILGPQRTFEESLPFIKNFCRHGFSVATFDLSGRSISNSDFVRTASKIAGRLRVTRPHLPLLVYGWSRGAPVAISVVRENKKLYSRLILENPKLDSRSFAALTSFPRRMTRIFDCREDITRRLRQRNITRSAVLMVPAHRSDCSHHLSALPEAQGPLLDIIESDFAGVQQPSNWYFSRLL